MKYFKSLGFYFFETLGSLVNLACSFFSYYPCLDWGIGFYVFVEGKRIHVEKSVRLENRQEKEQEASSLHQQAKDRG